MVDFIFNFFPGYVHFSFILFWEGPLYFTFFCVFNILAYQWTVGIVQLLYYIIKYGKYTVATHRHCISMSLMSCSKPLANS